MDTNGAAATSQTSATLTWEIGDILALVAQNQGVAQTWSAPSNTGVGLSWTPQQIYNNDSSNSGVAAWTAVATAASSGTVTATMSASQAIGIGVYQFRAPTGNSIAVGASKLVTGATTSPQQASIVMTDTDSSVVWVAGDWSGVGVETPSPAATSHSATSPGPSASPTAKQTSQYTLYVDELDDETLTGSVAFGYTGASGGPFSIIVVEIAVTSTVAIPYPKANMVDLTKMRARTR